MRRSNLYLSPICTNCLGDALISISNMYARLTELKDNKICVYYHHWPKYYDLLWPLIKHPKLEVSFIKLDTPAGYKIGAETEAEWKKELIAALRREDYSWHPSSAYSLAICRIHPIISQSLTDLKISEKNILTNSTELDPGVEYVQFNVTKGVTDTITFQNLSLHNNKDIAYHLDISSEVEKYSAHVKIDVSKSQNLNQLVASISEAKLHIGIDSGPTHIALALGKTVIMCFEQELGHRSLESIFHIYRNYHHKIFLRDLRKNGGLLQFQHNRALNQNVQQGSILRK